MEKLSAYFIHQIKATRETFRDPIVAVSSVSIIILLAVFVVWPLLEVVKQSFMGLDGSVSWLAYKNVFTMKET